MIWGWKLKYRSILKLLVPSRRWVHIPTCGKGKSSTRKCRLIGDMLVPLCYQAFHWTNVEHLAIMTNWSTSFVSMLRFLWSIGLGLRQLLFSIHIVHRDLIHSKDLISILSHLKLILPVRRDRWAIFICIEILQQLLLVWLFLSFQLQCFHKQLGMSSLNYVIICHNNMSPTQTKHDKQHHPHQCLAFGEWQGAISIERPIIFITRLLEDLR